MSVLVFLEHHDGEVQKGSLGVLAKAASLGDADAVLVGEGVRELAAGAGRYGAKNVHVADDASLAAPLSQPRVDVLATLAGGYDAVFFANSVLAADVAAGLAARLDAGLNWDLVDITPDFVGKRPALQDSVLVDVGWKSTPRLALFRSGAFDAQETGGDAQVEEATADLEDFSTQAKMVEQAHAESEGPSIEDADVIVAGGRGLGAPENFSLAEELARALGGAVGATRAVVDAGAGPAGLACALRLGQRLAEHPDIADRLGDVPVALVEKGKQPGSHLLSGAVVNPRSLRRLGYRVDDLPSYGPVHGEAVYVLTRRGALRIPPPPTMRNHGNWIVSLSRLGRRLAERAEEGGATILPETTAEKLLVSHGRVVGVRTGDKGRDREGGT